MDRHPVTKPNITGHGSPRIIIISIVIIIIITHVSFPIFNTCMRAGCAGILTGGVGIGDGVPERDRWIRPWLACLLAGWLI